MILCVHIALIIFANQVNYATYEISWKGNILANDLLHIIIFSYKYPHSYVFSKLYVWLILCYDAILVDFHLL